MRALALCLLVLAACGRSSGDIDSYIGATCTTNSQCADRCYTGGNFPMGFCSIPCNSDRDCPSDTVCADEAGGLCMFLCADVDCRRLGPNWSCRDKDNVGGGKDAVCAGN